MTHGLPFLMTLGLGFLASLGCTALARKLAGRLAIMDAPNSPLKRQEKPVPYLGGAALFCGFAFALVCAKYFFFPHARGLWPAALDVFKGIYSIFLGGLACMLLGLVDDVKVLSPRVKFAGQAAVALVLTFVGVRLRFVSQPWLSVALTVLWVVALTNAMNFVDIMDGLAAGIAAIAAAFFLLFSAHAGRFNDSIVALALIGSCLGFLVYNFFPARIYMGDAGSLFLGFTLAAIAINEQYSQQNRWAVFSPLLILALPIFDVFLMTVIRIKRGIPPWRGTPDHVPLRLRALGLSVRSTVLLLYAATAALGALAYTASFLSEDRALWVWGGVALGSLALAGWFMKIRMPYENK